MNVTIPVTGANISEVFNGKFKSAEAAYRNAHDPNLREAALNEMRNIYATGQQWGMHNMMSKTQRNIWYNGNVKSYMEAVLNSL
jgi:hypothetical protein